MQVVYVIKSRFCEVLVKNTVYIRVWKQSLEFLIVVRDKEDECMLKMINVSLWDIYLVIIVRHYAPYDVLLEKFGDFGIACG